MYFLTTPRIGFRLWSKDDIELASALWGDPEVTHFIDARQRLDAAQIEEKLNAELEMQQQHDIQYWPIFLMGTGQHVGCCGLRPKDATARIFEFGVHLCKPYWGAGLAAEAGHAAINYAFEHLKARQLFAGHHPENHGSRRLLEKLGFIYIGDQLYLPTGLEHPSYILMQTTSN
jgi:ribosomal-protein-alanine N-acetyltransferase